MSSNNRVDQDKLSRLSEIKKIGAKRMASRNLEKPRKVGRPRCEVAKTRRKTVSRPQSRSGKNKPRATGKPSTRESSTKGPPKTRTRRVGPGELELARPATRKKTGKPGAPKLGERKIGPDELDLIEREIIRGRSVSAVARELDVHPSTVQGHLERQLRPAWQSKLRRGAEVELAKIDHLEAIAWERMDRDEPAESRKTVIEGLREGGADLELVQRMNTSLKRRNATGWVAVVQWCIEMRCKLLGHFAATKVKVEEKDEFRVAGMSTDELDAKMMKMLLEKVEEKRRERAEMRRNGYPG